MATKWNFPPCFIFLIPLKNNSSKVNSSKRINNALITWDTQSCEELVLARKIMILEQSVNCSLKLEIPKQLLNGYYEKQWAK